MSEKEVKFYLVLTEEAPGRGWGKNFVKRVILNVYSSLLKNKGYGVVVEVETERDMEVFKQRVRAHNLLCGSSGSSPIYNEKDSLDMLSNSDPRSVTFRLNNSRDDGTNYGCGSERSMKFPKIELVRDDAVPLGTKSSLTTEGYRSHLMTVCGQLLDNPDKSCLMKFSIDDLKNDENENLEFKVAASRIGFRLTRMRGLLKNGVPGGTNKSPLEENFPMLFKKGKTINIKQRNNKRNNRIDIFFTLTEAKASE